MLCALLAGALVLPTPVSAQFDPSLPAPDCRCECAPVTAAAPRRSHVSLRPTAELPFADADIVLDVHEGLLNRIVRRTDQRQSPVRDYVLGADVHGTESTTTTIAVDLQPSMDGVALDLVLHGRNRSHTVGYTPQAAVRTLGVHQFTARKLVVHDGRLFRTERPRVDVVPSNQTLGVETPVTGVPLLGDVASSIGFRAAEAQRAQGEMIAAQKIRDGVGTNFNRQIDSELAKLNLGWINDFAPQLERTGFGDIGVSAQSSDEWARYAVQLDRRNVSRRVPQRSVTSNRTVRTTARRVAAASETSESDSPVLGRIAVRESLVQTLVDRLGLAGLTLKSADFADELAVAMNVVVVLQRYGLAFSEVPPEALAALQSLEIQFADRHPARVLFTDDEIILQVRAALAVPPLIKLPMMQIDLRYRIDGAGGDQIVLVPAGVLLRTVADDDTPLGPLAPLLESQANAALPVLRLPRSVSIPIPDGNPLELSVDRLQAQDGTLSLTVR